MWLHRRRRCHDRQSEAGRQSLSLSYPFPLLQFRFRLLVHLVEDLRRNVESRVRRRDSAVDGALQQDFFDLIAGYTVVEGGADVYPKFFAAIQGDRHCQCQQTARVARQSGTSPDVSPGIASDDVLKVAVEIGSCGDGAIHMLISKDGTPDFHALLVSLRVIHCASSLGGFLTGRGSCLLLP